MTIQRIVERVDAEARALNPVQVALTVVSAPFFAVGWTIGQIARLLWVVFSWAWTACLVGWRTARGE